MAISNLPRYAHRVEVWLEDVEDEDAEAQLQHLLTALFQWMRVGRIQRINAGPASGQMVLDFRVVTTCPPHELGTAKVVMRVSESQLLDSIGKGVTQ